MKKNTNTLKIFPIVLIIIVVIVVVAAWVVPVWQANLSLDIQLYSRKVIGGMHGVNFVQVSYLNWASFWAPLIPAAIVTIILLHPRKFLAIFTTHSAHKMRIEMLFSSIVFAASYGICYLITNFAYGFFMASYLQNDPSYVNFFASFSAMSMPFDPTKYDMNALLTWQYLTLPILNSILTACLIRLILEMIGARVVGGYAIEFLGRLFFIIGIVLAYFYLAAPLSSYNAFQQTWLYILPLTMWTFLSIGLFGLMFATFARKQRDREEVAGATFIIAIIIIIGMIIGPCIAAAGDYFSQQTNYEQLIWNAQVQYQVSQTRYAAGIDGYTQQNITSLFNITPNPQVISKIRPFNQNSSMQSLRQQIPTTYSAYETANTPDIILLNNSEYWVSLPDFNQSANTFGKAINQYVVYSCTQGFVAMNAHNGSVIQPSQYESIFGVNNSYPFYYGEGPNGDDGRNDIMLNIPGWTEVNNLTFPISMADGSLSGYYSSVKLFSMASTNFFNLVNQNITFLHRTNIFDRVSGMLLPYMYMDPDPYPVFDNQSHAIYYCCPIYISIPGFTYFQSNYIRFLGWVLVDVRHGYMSFYSYPGLDTNSLFSYAKIYVDQSIYPWQSLATAKNVTWLIPQLRYPEYVYQQQLQVNYMYHVTNYKTWVGSSDFYTQPGNFAGSSTNFVMMDLGNGLQLVTMSLVVRTGGATTLAGMFVQTQYNINDPGGLGQVIFFNGANQTLIGPETAEQVFLGYSNISQSINLVPNHLTGNILLYSFEKSLFYVIPIYSTSTNGLNILNYVGLVNATSRQVFWGTTPEKAFAQINATHVSPTPPVNQSGSKVSISSTSPPSVTSPSSANILLFMKNTNTNFTGPPAKFNVTLCAYSNKTTLYVNGTRLAGAGNVTSFSSDPNYPSLGAGMNYTIGSWQLYPLESRGLTVQLNATLGNFTTLTVPYRFLLTYSNRTMISTGLRTITFDSPGYASRNITGKGINLSFDIPASVNGSLTTMLGLNVTNIGTNMSAPAKRVQVILTLFSVSPSVNATPQVPGMHSISNVTFTNDPMYPAHKGSNYTVIDMKLASQALFGITMAINMPVSSSPPMTLVYRVALIVDGTPVGTTLLRIITWN